MQANRLTKFFGVFGKLVVYAVAGHREDAAQEATVG